LEVSGETLKHIYTGTLGKFSYFTDVSFLYTKHPEQIAITASIPLPAQRPTPTAGGEAEGCG
jgi:hypothetical protein